MLPDHHTHHRRCGHASGSLAEVVQAAVVCGLPAVGLTDHAPLLFLPGDHPLPQTTMARSHYDDYALEMLELRADPHGEVRVMASVEADFVAGSEATYRELLGRFPLDYVLGSVHWIDGWSLFGNRLPDGWTREQAWSRALTLTRAAAQSGLFDVIAHLDVLKTKGHRPGEWHTPELDETLDAIADTGRAIELNTSGWRKPVGECFPSPEIVALAARRGIPICLGSDAHRPQDVGAGFEQAERVLWDAGYRETVTFERGERQVIRLG